MWHLRILKRHLCILCNTCAAKRVWVNERKKNKKLFRPECGRRKILKNNDSVITELINWTDYVHIEIDWNDR